MQGKPIVSGRYSLWGESPATGPDDMLGVDGLVERLKKLPKSRVMKEGYSLIPVHAWSHSYDDVVVVAEKLAAAGGFEVVLPSELLGMVRRNVGNGDNVGEHCSCDQPGQTGAYSCTDGSINECEAEKTCIIETLFRKSRPSDACRVSSKLRNSQLLWI